MSNFTLASIPVVVASMFQFALAGFIAGPVQWKATDGGNDHYYGLFQSNGITWTDALDASEGLAFLGSQGHLVTITSTAESDFLRTKFGDQIGDNTNGGVFPIVPGIKAWIGLTDVVVEGNFQWVTGEPFTFSDWAPPEPNNLGNEDYVLIWRRDFGSGPLWSWNDSSNSAAFPVDGFFVEFEGPFAEPVPEPSTLALAVAACVSLIILSCINGFRKAPVMA